MSGIQPSRRNERYSRLTQSNVSSARFDPAAACVSLRHHTTAHRIPQTGPSSGRGEWQAAGSDCERLGTLRSKFRPGSGNLSQIWRWDCKSYSMFSATHSVPSGWPGLIMLQRLLCAAPLFPHTKKVKRGSYRLEGATLIPLFVLWLLFAFSPFSLSALLTHFLNLLSLPCPLSPSCCPPLSLFQPAHFHFGGSSIMANSACGASQRCNQSTVPGI